MEDRVGASDAHDETVDFDIRLVRGSGSEMKLVLAYVNPNAIGLRIYMQTNNACGWGWLI